MKYTGVLIAESVIDEAFLNFVSITERRQTPEGTIVRFTMTDDFAAAVVEEISKSLKPGSGFSQVESEYEKFIIFPNKIFKYAPKDVATRQKAIDYGKSLGIPEIQMKNV